LASLSVDGRGDVRSLRSDVSFNLCAWNLKFTDFSADVGEQKNVVGVEMSTRDCKGIGFYNFDNVVDPIPKLVFPGWTPTVACVDKRRYEFSKFRWFDEVDKVFGRQLECLSGDFPFVILVDPKPDEKCCKDDYFQCNNLGDFCSIEGVPGVRPQDTPPEPGVSSSSSGSGVSNSTVGSFFVNGI